MASDPKFPKTFIGFIITCVVICAVIAVFREQFEWLADLITDPGSKVPDPGEIDVPGIK